MKIELGKLIIQLLKATTQLTISSGDRDLAAAAAFLGQDSERGVARLQATLDQRLAELGQQLS